MHCLSLHAADRDCGSLRNAYGPFDYRTATADQKELVESAHFTLNVERLTKGESTDAPGPDLDYTLRAFPNHHRALMAMSKLSLRLHRPQPPGAKYSIDCYIERAILFQPDDPMSSMIAGLHFTQSGKIEEGLKYLDRAAELSDGNSTLHYNLGLGYFEQKQYDKSLEHAKRAYEAGFPLPGLRSRLQRAGIWKD
jgi:tetratricopeptide (TPR) repeat protein